MNAKPKLSDSTERMLAAVEKLLVYYQGGYKVKALTWCPLCITSGVGCHGCPWKILAGKGCVTIGGYDISEKRELPSPEWRAASIKRLTRWVRLIRNGTYDKKLKGAKP